MAVNGGKQVIQSTLIANQVDTAILTGSGFSVKVTNLSQTAPIYWLVDSPGGACTIPTVNGLNTFCAASAGSGAEINTRAGNFLYGAVVQLISAGTPQYLVELQSQKATS